MRTLAISFVLLLFAPVVHGFETPVSAAVEGRADATTPASIASSGTTSIAVWLSGSRILARELSSDGTPAGPTRLVAVGSHTYAQPVVAWLGDRYRVAWISSELRYEYRLETIDLDVHGTRIDGSAVDLGESLRDPVIASAGDRVLVAAARYASSRPALHWFVQEPSGTLHQGVLWVDFFRYDIVARGSRFEFILLEGNTLFRFDLENGLLSQLDVAPGRTTSFAAASGSGRTYVASATYHELTLTILEDDVVRIVPLAGTIDAWLQRVDVVDDEILVSVNLSDRTRVYRLDRDGNLLQQIDTTIARLALNGWIDGVDSLVAVLRRTDSTYRSALYTRRMPRTPDGVSGEGPDELFSVVTTSQWFPAIASSPNGATIVAWIEQGEAGETAERIRCAIYDPERGHTGDPIEIAGMPFTHGLQVAASESRFLVSFYRDGNYRAVTLDFAGNLVSDQELDASGSINAPQWAPVGDRFVLAYQCWRDGQSSIEVAFFDGSTLESLRTIAVSETLDNGSASALEAPLIATGNRSIMIVWNSYIPTCVSVPCFEPRDSHARLLDPATLDPVSDRIPLDLFVRPRDLAFDGYEYGIWMPASASIVRLSETGAFLDEEPIRVRDPLNDSYGVASSLHGLEGSFAVVWEEATQTQFNGLGVRVVHADGSLSPVRAFSLRSGYPSVAASAHGNDLLLAFTRMVPDDVMRGATRAFVRHFDDVPVLSPPSAPRIRGATRLGGRIIVSWDDLSDNEDLFIIEVRDSVRLFFAETYVALKDTSSRDVTPWFDGFDGQREYRVRAWNAAGPGEPSAAVTEAPPQRRRPMRP